MLGKSMETVPFFLGEKEASAADWKKKGWKRIVERRSSVGGIQRRSHVRKSRCPSAAQGRSWFGKQKRRPVYAVFWLTDAVARSNLSVALEEPISNYD